MVTRTRAAATPFGTGCSLASPPGLHPIDRPRLGTAFAMELGCTTPGTLALASLGFGESTAPNNGSCALLVASQAAVLLDITDAAATVRFPLAIPNAGALRGVQLTAQAAAHEPHLSPIGSVTLTHGLRVKVGD